MLFEKLLINFGVFNFQMVQKIMTHHLNKVSLKIVLFVLFFALKLIL